VLLAAASALPRLAVLLYERGDITAAYVDKGDDFARTFVDSGTYGFIPGFPSAYTQPLYGFFLVPIYWVAGRSWATVGLAHLAVAVVTSLLVYELGRRVVSHRVGIVAALVTTLHPYLVWHDMHMNREILDHALAVGLVLATIAAAERRSLPLAVLAGVLAGVAILGNVRLVLVPLVLAAYLLWQRGRPGLVAAGAVVAAAALVVAPWITRNAVSVGCVALTTDGRALWKANNENTLETLRAGRWIDDVPPIPGAPLTPQDAGALYVQTGRIVETDECAQMRFYRERALDFMREHPGEKAELALVGARMLWQPRVTKTEGRPGSGTWLDSARDWVEPVFVIALFALALAGARLVPRSYLVLAVALLLNATLAAMLFAGETRYRVPWDFLLAVPAGAAALALAARLRSTEAGRPLEPASK
jgi:4-amino-4-deoxy-L-arabinose transferase-like glycosyltransferase